MEYNFGEVEKKWQKQWAAEKVFKTEIIEGKPKYYVLDMFPYPSGAGLHVGHPLGYIASDIFSRYKRLKGFNVLHPMGYDAYGLPAEQYAIQTGTHPAVTTEINLARYREQLDKIGFSFDWDREVRTCDPGYYKWTQWTFIQLFNSWYNKKTNKAEAVSQLVSVFGTEGNASVQAASNETPVFSADEWNQMTEKQQQEILMHYRLAYLAETAVNWCPALGTVLANDEVSEGHSVRSGHPVERKKMKQWLLRITAYADRLLAGLNTIDWTESIKEIQRNWIGRSEGGSMKFKVNLPLTASVGEKVLPSGEDLGGVLPTRPDMRKGENLLLTASVGGGTPGDIDSSLMEENITRTKGYLTTDPYTFSLLKERAKEMRKEQTEAEKIIWEKLRKNQIKHKIRRQQIIDNYIVDFVCLPKKTIIEIDGPIHDFKKVADEKRALYLKSVGFEILRYKNEEVLADPDKVVQEIADFLDRKDHQKEDEFGEVLPTGEDLGGVLTPVSELEKGKNLPLAPSVGGGTDYPLSLTLGGIGEVLPTWEDLGGVLPTKEDPGMGNDLPLAPSVGGGTDYPLSLTLGGIGEVLPTGEDLGGVLPNAEIEVFTTRPDTIFGATFMVLAPEHELVSKITTPAYREKINAYVSWAKNRTERERMTEVKKVSGEFTGAYAINPFTNLPIPIWIADYVLMGYGTGAIMAVPAHDSRDFSFARHYKLPIVQVVNKPGHEATDPATWEESYDSKEGIMINSGFIDSMHVKEAISAVIRETEKRGIGTGKINFRLRDAIFSRQRYWGEPFPVFYKDGMPYTLPEDQLPLHLPDVDAYLPTESGEPPLARAKNWITSGGYPLETNTMPGFAGSSGYYLRYMDPRNNIEYFSKEAVNYWQSVDLYIGGAEHATGHLLYSRFWNKFLFDLGYSVVEEPFKKLINQGMIQGRSSFVYRVKGTKTFISYNLRQQYDVQQLHVDVNIVENDILDTDKFREWRPDFAEAEFILEDGKYHCGWEVEKMSKSMHNVVNPDTLIERYGADTLRLYEMFLGPLEQAKPWDTSGIEGVFRFIRKFWRLFNDSDNNFLVSDEAPTAAELKVLHKTIKKIQDDTERISFNTAVSSFMICVNELTELKCNKRAILNELVILVSPYAPHIAEELWSLLGNAGNVCNATFPEYNAAFTADNSFAYPVSFNGKTRFTLELPIDMPVPEIEKAVLNAPETQKWLGGVAPKKVIIVPKKIVNIVI